MATLNFIKGTIRGKIGQFVGSSWKGKNYIKTFTKPGNPRTVDQVAVRTVFQHVSHIAKALYANVLKPYTFPALRRQTAFNRMIAVNHAMFDGKAWEPEKMVIFEGPLHNPGITSAAISGNNAVIAFPATGGEATDKAIVVLLDDASGAVKYAEAVRSAGTVSLPIADIPAADYGQLHAYLAFTRLPVLNTEEKGQVSNTAYLKVTA
jgi:hypothetical protein